MQCNWEISTQLVTEDLQQEPGALIAKLEERLVPNADTDNCHLILRRDSVSVIFYTSARKLKGRVDIPRDVLQKLITREKELEGSASLKK